VEALRETWSRYPAEWQKDPSLNLGYQTLGEEWGGPAFADHVVDVVAPYLGPDSDVLELGCGGGKFSQRLAPRCRSLLCTDISPSMIDHTQASLTDLGVADNVGFRVLNGIDFDGVASDSMDFIFSYDVLLHVQPQNVFSYLRDARRVLRDSGVFMLHQINLASGGGMAHFLSQFAGDTWRRAFDDPRRRGHIYFMSEDQMRALGHQAGLAVDEILADSSEFSGVTAGRDLIGFLRKKRSRLNLAEPESVLLVKEQGGHTVYALIDDQRIALVSSYQFDKAGFSWDSVQELSADDLAAISDGGSFQPWE
jgi:2-polyprenyl-3-methyl-5-hydroxy-6-metoxy-1,4-benzoquinol methylase